MGSDADLRGLPVSDAPDIGEVHREGSGTRWASQCFASLVTPTDSRTRSEMRRLILTRSVNEGIVRLASLTLRVSVPSCGPRRYVEPPRDFSISWNLSSTARGFDEPIPDDRVRLLFVKGTAATESSARDPGGSRLRPLMSSSCRSGAALSPDRSRSAAIVLRKHTFDLNQFYWMSRHFVWLIPLTNLLIFLALGLRPGPSGPLRPPWAAGWPPGCSAP